MPRLPANRAQNIHYALIAERKIQAGEIAMVVGNGIRFEFLHERLCKWCGQPFLPIGNAGNCSEECRENTKDAHRRHPRPTDRRASRSSIEAGFVHTKKTRDKYFAMLPKRRAFMTDDAAKIWGVKDRYARRLICDLRKDGRVAIRKRGWWIVTEK